MVVKAKKKDGKKSKKKDQQHLPRLPIRESLDQLLNELSTQHDRVTKQEDVVDGLKEKAKAAKGTLKLLQKDLNLIILDIERERTGGPQQTKVPLKGESNASSNGHAEDAALVALGLSDSLIEKLGEAEIVKVSHLEKAIAEGRFVPRAIKGIGETAIDKITDIVVKWRQQNPMKPKETPAEPAAEEKQPEATPEAAADRN